MSSDNVLVTLNQTGIDLKENEIDSVLNSNDKKYEIKRRNLAHHFNIEENKLSKMILVRYAQADRVMTRVSIGLAHKDISVRLSDILLSVKRCYSYAEYRACIEMCALLGEMLANYLCIADKNELLSIIHYMSKDESNTIKRNGTSDKYFSDKYNQLFRLSWLYKADILDVHDKTCLSQIHELRIKYFHHWNTDPCNAQNDALDALGKISAIAAKYLDLLTNTPGSYNQANINRIKRYMCAVK